jgi:Kelch motif
MRFRLAAVLSVVFSACSAPTPTSVPQSQAPIGQPSSATLVQTASPATRAVGTWHLTAAMKAARAQFTATLLPDGRVLVAGGVDSSNDETKHALASAELYDPRTATWTATGSMKWPRAFHTATLLKGGKVLAAGGYCTALTLKTCPSVEDPDGAIAAAELYDPKTGRWTETGSMTTTRFLDTATLLPDGRVLVAGAEHAPDEHLTSTEIYDPAAGKWTATGSMITGRWQHFAVGLGDGRVLIAGGIGPVAASAELYNVRTGTWTATGGPISGRAQGGTAALLATGKVLLAGGDGGGDHMLATAELYDPATGMWTQTGAMSGQRVESAFAMLSDGKVFVVGGFAVPGGPDPLLATAEIYDPNTGAWSPAGAGSIGSFDLTATSLPDGEVLVVGGLVQAGVTSSAELFDPGP